jgi:hypothetical protein
MTLDNTLELCEPYFPHLEDKGIREEQCFSKAMVIFSFGEGIFASIFPLMTIGIATGISWVEARDPTNHPTVH